MVSSVLAQAILGQKAPDIVGSFREGQEIARQAEVKELAGQAISTGGEGLERLTTLDPEIGLAIGEKIRARNSQDINDFLRDAEIGLSKLNTGDTQGFLNFAQGRRQAIRLRGGDTSQTDDIINLVSSGNAEQARQELTALLGAVNQSKLTAGEQEFKTLTEGLSEEEVLSAKRRKLGLEARASGAAPQIVDVGGVPHMFDRVRGALVPVEVSGQQVTAETIAGTEAEIAGRKERALGQAKIATKVIDKSFEGLGKVQTNINNIDRAISALDRGAKTGAIQKFLPSISASSRELDQIRKELGLDVIGGVTFGALSQGELDLALDVALDTGLNEVELKDLLIRKRAAQIKTLSNLQEAVRFLSTPGATVSDFMQSKSGKPVVTTQQQFDALPSGAIFIEDGEEFRKP